MSSIESERDSANTARRERALASVDEVPLDADMDWADAQETRSDYGLGFLIGYLVGSREEAEIKDAEIGRLENLLDRARPLARKNLEQAAEIEELKAEIAALREAVGLLTTLPGAESVDCGLQITELASAIYSGVCNEIATLREVVRVLVSGDLTHRNCSADECMVAAIKNSGAVRRALEEAKQND